MRRLLLFAVTVGLWGASTVDEPDDTDTIFGFSFDFTLTVDSQPTLASVEWYVNQRLLGIVSSAPWTLNWTTFELWNGSHTVHAVLKNSGGTVLETTATNTFTIANGSDTLTATPSTAWTSPWSGNITFAVSFTESDGHPTDCYLYVDGVFKEHQQVSATPCNSLNIDTATLENGPRRIFVMADNAFFHYPRGMWEREVTVANTASNKISVEASSEVFVTVSGTYQLTCRVRLADSSTDTCTDDDYMSDDTDVATVSGSGLITGVGVGDTTVTVTSDGLSRDVRVTVNTASNLPHFGGDGSIKTAYTPGESMYLMSWFFADRTQLSNIIPEYQASGANAWEDDAHPTPFNGESEATWEARVDEHYESLADFQAASGLKMVGIGDGIARTAEALYKASRDPWDSWTPAAITYGFQKAKDSGFLVCTEMVDEVSFSWGHNPFPEGTIDAGGPFTQIVSTGSAGSETCTVTWTGFNTSGAHAVIIDGATSDAQLNSAAGSTFAVTYLTADTFSFPCPNVAAGTYNESTDPELTINVFGDQWFASNTDYVRNSAFTTMMSAANAVTGRTPIAWPVSGSAGPIARENWSASSIADYASVYWAATSRRHPYGEFLSDMIGDMRSAFQEHYEVMQRDKPWLMLTPAAGPMYRVGGVPVDVTSISNDGTGLITFDSDHGMGTLDLKLDRVDISGSSAVNGDFYVWEVTSSTTAKIAHKTPATTGVGFGGTAVFDGGGTYTVSSMSVDSNGAQLVVSFPTGGCEIAADVGKRFVLSGSDNSALNKSWFWHTRDDSSCTTTSNNFIWEIPATTSTGGTAYVITTNAYVAGRNELMVQGVHPRNVLAGAMYPVLQGAAGIRLYGMSNVNPDADSNASLRFQAEPSVGDGLNYNSGPLYDVNGMVDRWNAAAVGTQTVASLVPFLLQPRESAPDYGAGIFCTKRNGAGKVLLGCLNTTEGYLARSFDISGMGGDITRYRLTETGATNASASGPSDDLTIGPGETILWISGGASRQISGGTTVSGGTIVQ